jgi:hypothetical protein
MMEVTSYFEMLVTTYKTMQHHNPENHNPIIKASYLLYCFQSLYEHIQQRELNTVLNSITLPVITIRNAVAPEHAFVCARGHAGDVGA